MPDDCVLVPNTGVYPSVGLVPCAGFAWWNKDEAGVDNWSKEASGTDIWTKTTTTDDDWDKV
jgi:hypothetical protein